MNLNDKQRRTIDRWLSAVETGRPEGDYGKVTCLHDNPSGGQQITYGKHQTTEAGRRLQNLVHRYLARGDKTATASEASWLRRFVNAPQYSMVASRPLKAALQRLGREDPAMQEEQERFFLEHYMRPAMAWAEKNGFREALSMLAIYDSYIQSGSIPMWVRRRFAAVPPAAGGSERAWTSQYVLARHKWLSEWGDGKSPKSRDVRASAYRTRALLRELGRENWDLSAPEMEVNGIRVV